MGTGASAALMQNAAVKQKAGKIFNKKKEKKETSWSTPVVPLAPSDSDDQDHGPGLRLTASWQRKNKSEVVEQRPERIPMQRAEYHVHRTMAMLNAVDEVSEEDDFDEDPGEALDF